MKINYKLLSLSSLLVWTIFIIVTILDNLKFLGNDIGVFETLKNSTFARGMFIDIGILSTIFAIWIVFCTKPKFRYVFAFLTLFIGSFALLPFLSIYFYNKAKEQKASL